jgi:predicted alpha/beta-fold hydrolase
MTRRPKSSAEGLALSAVRRRSEVTLKQIGAPVGDGCDSANHRRKSKELVTAFYELAIKPEKTKRASAMHLKINGLNLHLEDRGNSDGLPLVFLHSWAGSTHSWKYVVAALPNRLRPITIDQRGWGRSESHSSGFQLADLTSDAKEVVKALKLDRYVLVGHSMGGKVAQLIASERPEKLSQPRTWTLNASRARSLTIMMAWRPATIQI